MWFTIRVLLLPRKFQLIRIVTFQQHAPRPNKTTTTTIFVPQGNITVCAELLGFMVIWPTAI